MNKLFGLFLLALAFLAPCSAALAQGGMGPGPGTVHSTGGFTPSCTESDTFLLRLGSAPLYGLGTTTVRDAYDTMICGMVTDGDWALLDALYIFATDNTTFAKLNLKSTSFTATYNGVPSEATQFTAGVGYTGNSTNVYLATGVNPAAGGTNYVAASSGSLGVYIPAAGTRTTGQNWGDIGICNASCATQYHDVYPKFTDNSAYAQFSGNASVAMTNAMGLSIGVRTSASAMALWKDGTSVVSNTNASGTLSSSAPGIFILAVNAGGTASRFSGDLVSAAFIGSGTIGVANISGRINDFMTAQGINAY